MSKNSIPNIYRFLEKNTANVSDDMFEGKITRRTGTFGRLKEYFVDLKDSISDKYSQRKSKVCDQIINP